MKFSNGFTLIEMMITVALIGILTAVALPSYREYVLRGQRADAKTALMKASQWLERAATASGSYPAESSFPAALELSEGKKYDICYKQLKITSTAALGTAYLLTASPKSPATDSVCGRLTLSQDGNRGVNATAACNNRGTLTGDIVQTCWDR